MSTINLIMLKYDFSRLRAEQIPEKCVLAFDPGSVNMGVSVVSFDNDIPHVVANATLAHPVHDLTNFLSERKKFLEEVNLWLKTFSPKGIVAERFQSRGLKGTTIECVSIMLGMLSMLKVPVLFFTAGTWKTQYQRRFEIDLHDLYREIQTTPHQFDASLIGCFGIEQGLNKKLDFNIYGILHEVENTALNGRKRMRKNKNEVSKAMG